MPYNINLPSEGTVFRAVGDNMNSTLYTLRNGQLVSLGGKKLIANTDLRLPSGQIVKAGQEIPGGDSIARQATQVDPAFRGSYWNTIQAGDVYDQQNGNGAYAKLPTYNIADIQQYIASGKTLPAAGGTITQNANVDTGGLPLANPNAVDTTTGGFQAQPATPTQTPTVQPTTSGTNAPSGGTLGGGTSTNADVQALLNDPSKATSGNYARVANGSIVDTTTGAVVSTGGTTTQTPATPTDTSGTAGASGGAGTSSTDTSAAQDSQLQALLSNSSLSADQKAAIQAIYDAVGTNDVAKANQLASAFTAATQYSSPYFKAQTQAAIDALTRGISAQEGDLSYREKQLQNALDKVKADTAASQGNLDLKHQRELQHYATKLEQNLNDTRDQMAAAGFTTSTRRARAEQIVNQGNENLVESANQNYNYQTAQNQRDTAYNTQNTAEQIANLQRQAAENKTTLARKAESAVGSDYLSGLGYDTLGGQPGSINTNATKDALSFANNFVF